MDFAVIFVVDGVLVQNDQYNLDAWRNFCERHGMKVEHHEISAPFGNTNAHFLRRLTSPHAGSDRLKTNYIAHIA